MTGGIHLQLADVSERLMMYGMLFSLSNRIQTIGDSQFDDITMKQHFLMIVLNMLIPYQPTLKETGELIGCSYQNVKRMAAQLEKSGYLHILPDAKDRRKQRLVATEKFVQVNAEKQAMADAFMNRLYDGITDAQLRSAIEVLQKMDHNLGGSYEQPVYPTDKNTIEEQNR